MRNILLLGIADSLFVRDFCKEVLNGEDNVVLLSQYYSKKYEDDYRQCHVKQVEWPKLFSQGIVRNLGINIVNKYISCIKDLGEEIGYNNQIDIVFIHYVEPLHILYLYPFFKKAKQKIFVFWGDDILRATNIKLRLFPFFMKNAQAIVFMIDSQREFFQSKLGHKYDKKIHVIDFGNSILKKIDEVSQVYSKEQCKERFGLSVDKMCVHVGYNAFRGQQHIEIINGIVRGIEAPIYREWLDKLEFVFHVSYGKDDDFEGYMNEMKQIMDTAGMRYVFIEEYLQDEGMAMFRKTCDIFLYGQKTDARSASPLEYIYAGARFVCPIWLANNYEDLKLGENVCYIYNDFEGLTEVFGRCVTEYYEVKDICDEDKMAVRDAVSWESLAPKWRALYE